MDIRSYEEAGEWVPHIYGHGVTEDEVRHVLRARGEDLPGTRGSRMKLGQTTAGRYLKVIYVPDEDAESIFVIAAYELRGKARTAYRRRQRKKTAMREPKFPPGWDEERVRQVLAQYEDQSEDEEFGEIEAAREAEGTTLMAVPTELAPQVRALIAQRQGG